MLSVSFSPPHIIPPPALARVKKCPELGGGLRREGSEDFPSHTSRLRVASGLTLCFHSKLQSEVRVFTFAPWSPSLLPVPILSLEQEVLPLSSI